MRILFLGNNWVGWQIMQWLKEQGEDVVGLVVHPGNRQKYGKEIIKSSGLDSGRIFDGSRLHDPETLESIRDLRPDLGVSALFGYILRQKFLDLVPAGCLNIHPALLPYNRGAYPNIWSIVDGTPAGVTLHYIDTGVDTGDIVAQRETSVTPIDTGESLYRKLEKTCVDLFRDVWPSVRSLQLGRVVQKDQTGTCYKVKDVERINEIDLDRTYRAKELIDVIRALTFPRYPGAYFRQDGRKVYLRLQLLYEEELGNDRR